MMNIYEISEKIAQRPPFQMIEKVTELVPSESAVGIKNVSVKGANGKLTWAPKGGDNSVKRYFADAPYSDNKKYIIYTSTYADFANTPIPTGKMNLTGIWKQFNGQWELIIRDAKDIEPIEE